MAINELIPKEKVTVETATGEKPVIRIEPPQDVYEKKKKIIRNKQIIWYALLILEAILAIRFVVKLFGANPLSPFSILITVISTPFTFIFTGLFPPSISAVGNTVIEWSTLFAMLIYAVIAFLVSWFYRIKKPIDPREAEEKVDQPLP